MKTETYSYEKTFTEQNYANALLLKLEFEKCSFVRCDFTGANLAGTAFRNCTFDGCNLSMAKLPKANLTEVLFKNSKLMGVDFYVANDFTLSMSFDNCILDYASFARKRLKQTTFIACRLTEANFNEADLSGSVFQRCDLTRAQFNGSNLSGADLSTAFGISIDPEATILKKARISLHALPGLLERHGLIIEE